MMRLPNGYKLAERRPDRDRPGVIGYTSTREEVSLRTYFFEHRKGDAMELVSRLWNEQDGQDIAEYAVMLAVILVIVVGTIRLIGSNANNVFSNVASSIQ
jgi:Flp pilus assembly pilin Flp